jgi:hypothetical protein
MAFLISLAFATGSLRGPEDALLPFLKVPDAEPLSLTARLVGTLNDANAHFSL